jgi:hypothetical protein
LYVQILRWRKTRLDWCERLSARKIKGEKIEGKGNRRRISFLSHRAGLHPARDIEFFICGVLTRNLHFSPSIIRMIKSREMRWAAHVARMGEKRNAYRIFVGNPEGKRPLERPRRR